MRDFGSFHQFLESLAPLLSLDFELWDGQGLAFTSKGDSTENQERKKREVLASQLMGQNIRQSPAKTNTPSMLGVPIRSGEEAAASLIAISPNGSSIPETRNGALQKTGQNNGMETLLNSLARLGEDYWSHHNEIESLTEEISQNYEELSLYTRISTYLRNLEYSETMLLDLIKDLLETTEMDLVFVHMPDESTSDTFVASPKLKQHVGYYDLFVTRLVEAIDKSKVLEKEEAFILKDSKTSVVFEDLAPDPYRLLLTRIENAKSPNGWLGAVTFGMEDYFKQNQLRLAEAISRQISIQFINLDLYNDLKRFVIGLVRSLVSAIEAKDSYTRGHSERVTRYAIMIAKLMQLNREQRHRLRWAAILHDVGKIGISDKVLNKKGPLTDEEFGLIKQHPKKGYDILKPVEQISYVLPVVLHHHERYDGKGYPEGLIGDAIPLEARIIAVADTFDAITSTRAYRSRRTGYEAMEIIDKVSGTQLDPKVVDAFIRVYDKFLAEKL